MSEHLHRHSPSPEPHHNNVVLPNNNVSSHNSPSPSHPGDLDLESAIGDAFKQFAFLNPEEDHPADPEHLEHENLLQHHTSEHDVSIDLEAAVGNAFLALAEQMSHDQFDQLDQEMEREMEAETDPLKTEELESLPRDSEFAQTTNVLEATTQPDIAPHGIAHPIVHPIVHDTVGGTIAETISRPTADPIEDTTTDPIANPIATPIATVNEESHKLPSAEPHTSPELNPAASPVETHSEVEVKHEEPEDEEEDAELDLEAAIGNAFKNLTEDLQADQSGVADTRKSPTLLETRASDQETTDQFHRNSSETHQIHTEDPLLHSEGEVQFQADPKTQFSQGEVHHEDNKLEDAIDQAFKSLTDEFDQLRHEREPHSQPVPHATDDDDHILHDAIFASFTEIMGHEKQRKALIYPDAKDDSLDLNSVVQNVVQQISLESNSLEGQELSIPKDMLQDLALEISHQVHHHESAKRGHPPKEIPHIDDNILAHFQLEANKGDEKHDDAKDDDPGLKTALASAMRNVLQQAAAEDVSENPGEKPESLEKLQMNEILQNAFTMAMQNPQELLTSLELNDEESAQTVGESSSSTLSTAAALAALSVKEALSKHDGEELMGEKTSTDGKSLSIAETLALHRSSMANIPRREFSTSLVLEDTMREQQKVSTMNPQLSNILSSLSQHIQSGNQSQNLMLVIRQMTNALMLNKASSYTMSSATQEILQEVQTQPHEQKFFIDSLKKAKGFLSKDAADEAKRRALSLIENVIGLVNGKTEDGQSSKDLNIPEDSLSQVESSTLSQFYSSALSTLSNFNSSRFRGGLGGEKLDVDSNEYKERIRVENRERKKRWREENSERNKDNDLRSRVIKRANYMFGESQSTEKKVWVEDEFNKRRAKRLAKQKKEETDKSVDSQLFVDTAGPEAKHASTIYSQDPKLVKRLTDFFKIVAEAGNDEDPQALMTATSAATAVAASEYATSNGISDGHIVQSAMSQILTNVLDATVRSGNFTRISFLSKGTSYQPPSSSNNENRDLINRFSGMPGISTMESGERKSAIDILRRSQKRFGMDFLSGDSKRSHLDNETPGLYVEKDKSSMSRIQYEIDQLRNSISTSTSGHIWGSATGLKMPLYKKPTGTASQELPSQEVPNKEVFIPTLPVVASPFISNKIGLKTEMTPGNSVPGGLKKPGSFQRPAFSKAHKGRSLGFPTLYSASFSQK